MRKKVHIEYGNYINNEEINLARKILDGCIFHKQKYSVLTQNINSLMVSPCSFGVCIKILLESCKSKMYLRGFFLRTYSINIKLDKLYIKLYIKL